MNTGAIAIVGAAETTGLGTVSDMSALGLHLDAARNALRDCGLGPKDVDGVAAAGLQPYMAIQVAHLLGIEARWVDATMVGGCSFLVHVRHAAAAIAAGHCTTVLITHGESGRSHIGGVGYRPAPDSLQGQFELPFGAMGPMTMLSLGLRRYMRDFGLTREHLAMVAVVQREWASCNPRALFREPLSVETVLAAPMIADPLTRAMCCPLTDGGGGVVLTSAERARDFPTRPVYVLGAGEANGVALISQMPDLTTSEAYRRAGAQAFAEAGLAPRDIDHLMLYDAAAHLPLFALEDLGFLARGEAGPFVAARNTAPGGSLPVNTNGGGLSYTHSGMYGVYALQESVRQLRGEAAAQVDGAATSLVHGLGGMFQAAATLILSNDQS